MSKNQSLKIEFSSNMNIYFISFIFNSFLMWKILPTHAQEPEHVCSRFTYEEQTLGKMARVKVKMEQWDKELKTFEESILSVLANRRKEMTKFAEDLKLLDEMKNIQDRQDKQLVEMNLVIAKQGQQLQEMSKEGVQDEQQQQLKNVSLELTKLRDECGNKTTGRQTSPIIAFNAYLTSNGNIPDGQVLKFPHVLLNEGNTYDAGSGYFVAPVSGLYQFFAHVCQQSKKAMVYAIYHEDKMVSLSTVYEDLSSTCASTGTLLNAKKGDRVCVKSKYYNNYLFSDVHRRPSFMGVLLHQIDD